MDRGFTVWGAASLVASLLFAWSAPPSEAVYYRRGAYPQWSANESCFPSRQPAQTAQSTTQPHYIPGHLSTNGEPPAEPPQQPQTKPPVKLKGYASPGFITTTTGNIEGYKILEYKGLVEGVAVRQPTWSQDAAAGMQEQVGGSLDSYAQMCEEARQQAFGTLLERARQMGANAIVGIHFDSESFPMDKGKFSTAVVCWGTAVFIQPEKGSLSASR